MNTSRVSLESIELPSFPAYVLSQEAAILSGAALTRAGLQALAPLSVAHFLAGDLAVGMHVVALLHRLLDRAADDEDLGNDALALSARWNKEARRFLGWEDRQNVLLADFPGCEGLIPLFRKVGLGVTMLRDAPAGVAVEDLARATGAVVVRNAAAAKLILS